jgi:hypothetical protein
MGLLDFLKRGSRKKQCARCGQQAAHGYSPVAESDAKQIAPLCLSCLVEQLRRDYADFRGRAIVIAPAPGLPCYVFREREFLRSTSSESEWHTAFLLQQIGVCTDCQAPGRCLWIESRGLTSESIGDVVGKGPQETLLRWGNPVPISLCGKCTAERIGRNLQMDGFEFFEVCSPHQDQEGIVLPMAY